MLQSRSILRFRGPREPWDERVFVIGTFHKGGSTMMYHIVEKAFEALGADMAKESCVKGGSFANVTECMQNNFSSIRLLPGFTCPRDLEDWVAVKEDEKSKHSMCT